MQFEELLLDSSLLDALARMGHSTPTMVQQQTIPMAMQQYDIMAKAPTGTGKTASFLLPILQHFIDFPRRYDGMTRALILTPTRELASQVHRYATHLALNMGFDIKIITGGVPYGPQEEALSGNIDLLVATPGRLLEYMEKGAFNCEDVEILVIDEADRMLDMGFTTTVTNFARLASNKKMTMLFSATLDGYKVTNFAKELLKDPKVIEVESPRKEKAKIHQWIHLADTKEHKFALLCTLLKQEQHAKVIVFVKKRESVASLHGLLLAKDIKAAFISGDLEQKQRFQAIGHFSKGEVNVLIATDVASRGIDIEAVDLVINYDMPQTADVYLHRIGRTGRAGAKGTAISLIEAHDIALVRKVENYLKETLKRRTIEGLEAKHKEAKLPSKTKVKVSAKVKKAKAKKVMKKLQKRTKKKN